MPRIPKVTRALLLIYVVFALGRPILSSWLGSLDILPLLALVPERVARGQIWRLFTYPFFSKPWLDSAALGFLWSGFVLYFVSRTLESVWGSRMLARRVLLMIAAPGILTALVGFASDRIGSYPYYDLSPLIAGMFVAFASTFRDRPVQMVLLPVTLAGDQLIYVGAGFILVEAVLQGTIIPFIPDIFAYAFGLAWFRFDLAKDVRRSWLRYRKSQLETKVERLRRERNLRVIRNDEDDDGSSYLH